MPIPIRAIVLACLTLALTACDSPSSPDNSPLTDEEILAVAPPDFEVLVQAFDNVRRDHPRVEVGSPAFARLLLDEVAELSTAQETLLVTADAFALLRRLTDAEWLIIVRNLDKATRMKEIALAAHARAAAELPGTPEDGTGDAFRHAYWNVLMAREFGVQWARDWGTAHESETPNVNRKTMDLNNNAVGLLLFSADTSATNDALATRIKAYPLACSKDVTFNSARLIYFVDCPTIRVFDDGPHYDDVYEVSLGSTVLGTTPAGGGRTFETNNLVSGPHTLRVRCTVDGTHGDCGYEVVLEKGLTFPNRSTRAPQQVLPEGGAATFTLIAPTLAGLQQQGQEVHGSVLAAPAPAPTTGARL